MPGVVLIVTDDAFERRSLASSIRRHGLTVVETASADGIRRLAEITVALRIVTDNLEFGLTASKHTRYDGGHLLVDEAATRIEQQRLSKMRLMPVKRPYDRVELVGGIVEALRPKVLGGPSVASALLESLARELLHVGGDAIELLEAVDIWVVDQALRHESGNVTHAAARIGESVHYVRDRRGLATATTSPAVIVVAVPLGRMEGRLTRKLRALKLAVALEAARDAKSIRDAARKLGGEKYRRYLYRVLPPDVRAALHRAG